MVDYISEGVEVCIGAETTRGTAPSSGWSKLQVDVGGVSGLERTYVDVERDIHSVNATQEKGDHVAYSVEPSLTHDLNKDFVDAIAQPSFRCDAKHLGGTGLSLFRPTAVVDGGVSADSFTVAALGALPDGMLIKGRGFTNSGNNGLFVTSGTSDGTNIKVATGTLTAEASPPANATVDVVGFQGAAGDLELDVSGNLTSTALDFTTLGLVVGMWIYLPSTAEATAMGSANYAFSNAAYTGRARITAIAVGQLTLERHTWTLGAATTETTSTVRVFASSRFYRNYAIDDTLYDEHTVSLEKTDVKPGDSAATRYTCAKGCGVNTLQISAPIDSKITATVGFIGMTATTPVAAADRVTGPSTAYEPLGDALLDTQNDLREVRLTDSGGSLVADVESWTYNLNNNVKARKSQGVFGASGLNYGKFMYSVNMNAYYQDSDAIDASDENRDGMAWDAFIANHQYGLVLDLPNVALRNPSLNYAANEPVMINCDIVAFRSLTDGIAGSMSVFGYIPTE